jgi:pilus assembly protein FimV
MNKKLRKIILPVSILAASQAYALGLGNLQVNSALDEALSGEIPLVLDSNEDIEGIAVSLASGEDYQRVGLDKSYVPTNIKVAMAEKDNQQYIEITSKGPVSEPIVSLLLVVDWANGHLLREYTLLLDPPVFNSQQTQQNYSEPVQTQTYQAPSQIEDVQLEQQNTTIVSASNVAPDQVIVEAGDTLWKIASRYNDGYSSPQQMMVAIFNNNPSAFQSNDMNLIKKGAILDIPTADQVAMISNGDAISEVRSQIQKWSRLQTGDDGIDYDTQSSVDYGIELTPPNDADNSDSSNSSGSSTSSNGRVLAQLSQAKEDLASSNQENDDLAARIRDLEQIVADQESALSLKDTDLALLQQQLQQSAESNAADTSSIDDSDDAVWSSDDALGTTEVEDAEGDTSDQSTTEVAIEDPADDSDDLTDGTDEIVEQDEDDTTDYDELAISDVVTDQADDTVVEEENAAENSTDSTPVQTQSLMDKVLSYKTEALIGLGALLLAILGFVFFKNKGKDDDLGAGGFLDDISNSTDDEIVDELSDELVDDPSLDTDDSELNFSNLDDELDNEVEEISEAIGEEIDLSLEEEPEVVVMDDQLSEEDTDTDSFDLDLDDLDLSSIEEQTSDETTFEESDSEADEEDTKSDEDAESEELVDVDSDEFSLDFDLDEIVAEDDADTDEKDSVEQLLEEDFNLELDLNDEDQDLEEVVTDNDELNELVFDTGEHKPLEDDVDLDADTEELEFDLSEDLFNTDELELDLDDEVDDALNLTEDTGEYSIDFEGVGEDDDTEAENIDIGLDFDDIVDDDAIDTKLDLAKAYFEMGDIDGAQQMITEIIEEGSDAQKSKAEELRAEIEKN